MDLTIPQRGESRGWRSGDPIIEGFGDASYEEGYGQTGTVIKYMGMTIFWKSCKQVQVPRSTAEAECTAMAYSAQFVEGLTAMFHDMRIHVGIPKLYCDNRAAVHLSAGSGEWRTKALVNRVLGVRSLVELGLIDVGFLPTADMQADSLTKFMGAKVLKRQRDLVGCTAGVHNVP